jgi:hypothetical protein
MTYIAAWLLLSLIGLAAWFCLTPYTEDEYADETIRSHYGRSLRPVHIDAASADAGEENDACPRALAATNIRSE